MLDKMKQLMEMQRKMQEVKRELDAATFDISSSDGVVKIVMNGSQEVREVVLRDDVSALQKPALEKALKDAYNRAIKRSHEIAAAKMKQVSGLNIPGLF